MPRILLKNPRLRKTSAMANSTYRFCQGLNTAQPQPERIFRDDNDENKPHRCAPFLFGHYRTFNWGYYYTGITDHISCRRLTSSIYSYSQDHINLYDDLQMPFHITFFEILPSYMSKHKKYDERGRWSMYTIEHSLLSRQISVFQGLTLFLMPVFNTRSCLLFMDYSLQPRYVQITVAYIFQAMATYIVAKVMRDSARVRLQ